jgi:transglutaminase-like putative cysteine protease
LSESQQGTLDLGESLSVKVDRPLVRAHETQRVRYQVRWNDGDPSALFVAGPSQEIQPIDQHTAIVTVHALRPGQPAQKTNGSDDSPTEADRRPNNFIQSDDPEIVALAQKVAGNQTDPWQAALALEQYVGTVITQKDYTQAFATASEVLKNHAGDCTEHAVLLAALARARGIPARVAMGLVYMPSHQAFGYHMWTEVFVQGQWIGIDGTLARGGIGAAHLKLAHHSLEGTSAYSTFLPIAQAAGKLQIEILGDSP